MQVKLTDNKLILQKRKHSVSFDFQMTHLAQKFRIFKFWAELYNHTKISSDVSD